MFIVDAVPVGARIMMKAPTPKLPAKSPLHVPTRAGSTEPTGGGTGAGVRAVGVLGVLLPQAWSIAMASAETAIERAAGRMMTLRRETLP